jgi:hypothetical protein
MFTSPGNGKNAKPVKTVRDVRSQLNRASSAFKAMKKAERALNKAREEYHRLARRTIYSPNHVTNNSVRLSNEEDRLVKLTAKVMKNAGSVKRFTKNLPNNMMHEIFNKIKQSHLANYRRGG